MRRPVHRETLLVRINEYIRQNLRNPDLGPAGIAAVHNISRRQLFDLFARAGLSLEQSIISRRLEAAYDELGQRGAQHRSIATIAHEWGFRDAAHFTRRFKEAFEMTPRERRASVAAPPPSNLRGVERTTAGQRHAGAHRARSAG